MKPSPMPKISLEPPKSITTYFSVSLEPQVKAMFSRSCGLTVLAALRSGILPEIIEDSSSTALPVEDASSAQRS